MKHSLRIYVYITLVSAAASIMLVMLLVAFPFPSASSTWVYFASLSALTGLAYVYELHFADKVRFGLSTVVYFAILVTLNPASAALAVGAGLITGSFFRKGSLRGKTFNIAQSILYVGLGSLVLYAVSPSGLGSGPRSWVALSAAGLCAVLLNVTLVSGVVHLQTGRGFFQIWSEMALVSARQDTIMACLGVAAAMLVQRDPWTLGLILFPAVALYLTFKRSCRIEKQQSQLIQRNNELVQSLQSQALQLQKAITDLEAALEQNMQINLSLEAEIAHRKQAEYDLTRSYDAMLEGLSRALELRDRETEGHSERVADLTLELAKRLGIPEIEWDTIRRGAILHDIGKIGIPDAILLKSAGLDEREWETMRRHPVYAFQLIESIEFLRPALPIPYCHHEKWDGSGYPSGLRGEDIPLAARVFALADVWDALRSDRPYRPAWSDERARAYIASQSGKHFDPEIVRVFLGYLDAQAAVQRPKMLPKPAAVAAR